MRKALSSVFVICRMTNHAGRANNQHQRLNFKAKTATTMTIMSNGVIGTPATVGARVQPLNKGTDACSEGSMCSTFYEKNMAVIWAAEPATIMPIPQRPKVSFSTNLEA